MRFCGQCGAKLDASDDALPSDTANADRTGNPAPVSRDKGSSETDYDEAVRMSQEIEQKVTQMMSAITPLGLELQIATAIIACVYPAVWAVLAFFYIAVCVFSVKRGKVRARLKDHDVEGAKAAFASAQTWSNLVTISEVAMAFIELWGFVQLLKFFKGAVGRA